MKLESHLQFVPNHQNVAAILDMYSLKLTSYILADSGIENLTVFAHTTSGEFVLRVYRQSKKSDAEIDRELDFVEYLADRGIPVPRPIANARGERTTHVTEAGQQWQAILMPRLPGEHADNYSPGLITSLAKLQAKMHLLAADYPAPNPGPGLTTLREGYFAKLVTNRHELDSRRLGLLERAETYHKDLDPQLPRGLCHLDYDTGNVLSYADEVTAVLDFDDLQKAPFVMCLGYTLLDVLFEAGPAAAGQYLRDYQSLRPLSELEKSFIPPVMLFRLYVYYCHELGQGPMSDAELTHFEDLERQLAHTRFDKPLTT